MQRSTKSTKLYPSYQRATFNRLILSMALSFLFIGKTASQYATITFDYEKARFGENQPLPSETPIIFSGPAGPDINMVEVRVLPPKGKENREALAFADWKRPKDKSGVTNFNVLMNYKLRAAKKYDLEVAYFRLISEKERQALNDKLGLAIATYIESQMGNGAKRITFDKSAKRMLNEMNELAASILSNYRPQSDAPMSAFSELTKMKIEQIESANLKKLGEGSTSTPATANAAERSRLIEELQVLTASEVEDMTSVGLLIFADSRYVEDYPTEDKAGYFAINAGYGGVYLGGNLENLEYGTSPYLGLALPLSTSTIAPRFLRNASITVGIFTQNLDREDGVEISGPLVGRPLYLGLDYKLFQFVRFNAGTAFLEEPDVAAPGGTPGSGSRIFLQPFIGLSAKVNLNLSLDK